MVWVIDGISINMAGFRFRFGLRAKLLLLSSFLFVIPWFGYQYVWEMEKYLRFGQEQTLVGTARALATALHERPKLFDNQASFLPSVEKGKDLYGYQLNDAIQLDGLKNDWPNHEHSSHFYGDGNILPLQNNTSASSQKHSATLNFTASVGKYDKYLYLFFKVNDDHVIFRGSNSRSIVLNDHLQLSFINHQGQFKRYIISNKKSGWLSAFELIAQQNEEELQSDIVQPAPIIQGQWLTTNQGYNVEMRIPLIHVGDKIAFAINNVNEQNGEVINRIGSAIPENIDTLGTVLVPSPEIERIVNGMRHTNSSIWVVDHHHRVLASAGSLKTAGGFWQTTKIIEDPLVKSPLWHQFKETILLPLYYKILTKPPTDFIDKLYDAQNLTGKHIIIALSGKAKSQWRLTTDQQALVLSAAYPIFINNQVKGAVIVEETTNGIRTLRNQALEKLFTIILAIMILGALTFLLFASRITTRIRQLSNQAEQTIDQHGRITGELIISNNNDEIGDLSRSFSRAVQRLQQYNHYLENMSARLSHELRTPIAVVKTSLETLVMQDGQQNNQDNPYIKRAQTGINTLNQILTNMSEATRLEQMLINTDKVEVDIISLLQGCTQGYQHIYHQYNIKLKASLTEPVMIIGSAEHIVQLLDKVVNNAVEFSNDKIITINVDLEKEGVVISIENNGVHLPDMMITNLFDSMVSIRKNVKQNQPHLGLGLYIARLICQFHEGTIGASNHYNPDGVTITIKLPLKN